VERHVEAAAHPFDEVRKIEVLETERGDIEGDADVEAIFAPVEPLPQYGPQAPQGKLVDEAMFFGERDEHRRLDRPELRIVPPDQRFDLFQRAVSQRNLWLVDHVQMLFAKRLLKPVDDLQLRD